MPSPNKAKRTRKHEAKENPRPRILGVKMVREIDTNADMSYYGEYSQRATSPYSIDRAHTAECANLEANHRATVDKLERIIRHVQNWREQSFAMLPLVSEMDELEGLDIALDCLATLQDDAQECDCGERGDMLRHEYRFFNPSRNYVNDHGEALPGNTPEEVRKYVKQDYERMESLNRGEWSYLGLRAEARIGIPNGMPLCYTVQNIRSGGLWGIESDSDAEYFKEVASDELDNLKRQLSALGFSKRAIATAFKNVQEVDA